jgi:branched-chain amino acid transport system substrate-binding protein
VPSYYSESNYTTAQWIHEVMKKTGGKWPGVEEFIKSFASIKLDSIRGPVSLDDQLNPIQNIYIRQVEKKALFGYAEAELWNTVVKTYAHVGQYWTYDKKAFLAQPVYSRDFPPCKHCE